VIENTTPFGEVLDAVSQLSSDEQETLLVIVRHRLAEQRRKQLAQDVREAREEFAEGRCKSTTVEDLMQEILS
jgi:tryptophan 2,3-dioxygenase